MSGGGGGEEGTGHARCIWSGQNKGQYSQTGIVGIFSLGWRSPSARTCVKENVQVNLRKKRKQ